MNVPLPGEELQLGVGPETGTEYLRVGRVVKEAVLEKMGLPPAGSVLDIGCGSGRYVGMVVRQFFVHTLRPVVPTLRVNCQLVGEIARFSAQLGWRSMTKVEKLEREIRNLNPDEFAAFREWFREYDSDEWDRGIEDDIRAGKLDGLAEEALAAHEAGETKGL